MKKIHSETGWCITLLAGGPNPTSEDDLMMFQFVQSYLNSDC